MPIVFSMATPIQERALQRAGFRFERLTRWEVEQIFGSDPGTLTDNSQYVMINVDRELNDLLNLWPDPNVQPRLRFVR